MFTQELHELLAPTGIDLIGKEHFDRTGAYLAIQEINSQMILQMIQTGGLDQYLHADKDEIHELIREASEIVRQETPFFHPDTDVSVRKAMRCFTGFQHTHHYFEIQCVLQGSADYTTPVGMVPVKQNDLILVPPDTAQSLFVPHNGSVISIGIRKSTFEKAFRDILSSDLPISHYFRNTMAGKQNNEIFFRNSLDDFSTQLLLMMYRQQKVGTTEANKINDHLAQSFTYYIAEKSTDETMFGTAEYLQDKIWDIRMYMVENFQSVTLASAAKHFHYSESYLSRLISRQLGMSFSQLLQTIRLEKSCELLINSDIKITELCERVGYDNESYYIQLFRRTYGITPLQYRKRHRTSNA
jgi:AraC-like DNA-binding protein/mannose-6-phosphate isomerase-like protein (cupin superfamily)